jgi:hypothetical protein
MVIPSLRRLVPASCALLALCPSAPAAPSIHEECVKSFIREFKVTNMTSGDYQGATGDFCALPSSVELPKEVMAHLLRIRELHGQISKFFGHPMEKLVPGGIRFQLDGTRPSGATLINTPQSPASGVFIGGYADWAGNELSPWEYAHEVVHLIMVWSPAIAPGFGELAARSTFSEFIADYVVALIQAPARDIVFSSYGDLDPALVHVLRLESNLTYKHTMREFAQGSYIVDKARECAGLPKDPEPSAHTRQQCAFTQEQADKFLKQWPAEWLAKPFSPELCKDKFGDIRTNGICDSHRIGYVLTSFLLDLTDQFHRDMSKPFFAAIAAMKEKRLYSCGHRITDQDPGESRRFPEARLPLSQVFRSLRASLLSDEERKYYDQSAQARKLALLVKMDELEMVRHSADFTRVLTMPQFFKGPGNEAMNPGNYPCWGKVQDMAGDCRVSCRPVGGL